MTSGKHSCRRIQLMMRNRFMNAGRPVDPSVEIQRHLDRCPRCRSYWAGLQRSLRVLSAGPPLYTVALRRKTMQRVVGRSMEDERSTWLYMLVPPLALASLLCSFILPLWLFQQVVDVVCPQSGWLVILGAIGLIVTGFLVAGAAAAPLVKRREWSLSIEL